MKKTMLFLMVIVALLFAQGNFYPPEIEELIQKLSHSIIAVGMAEHPDLTAAKKLADVDATRKLAQFYGQKINSIIEIAAKTMGDKVLINLSDTTQTTASHNVRNAPTVKTVSEKTTNGYLVFVMKAISIDDIKRDIK